MCGKWGWLRIFVLYEIPDVATLVSGALDILQLFLIPAADQEKDGQRYNDDACDASHDTTDDGSDNGM